jgi:membrane-bound metal-dependent hydrolase YbcI (DUF457 family)
VPFTPFHFGPGLLLKAAAPARFSLTSYAAAQVVIDLESGYYLLTQQAPVHRTLHTFLVGGAAGAVVGATVGLVGRSLLRRLARSPRPLVAAELAGSSTLLDGMMHYDMHPFWPLSSANPLLGLLSLKALHLFCVVTAVLGLLLLSQPRLWRPTGDG